MLPISNRQSNANALFDDLSRKYRRKKKKAFLTQALNNLMLKYFKFS